jgi:hypothetical protein
VAVQVLGRLTVGRNADRLRKLVETDVERLTELVERDEAWMARLAEQHTDGQLDSLPFTVASKRLAVRIKANRKELDRARGAVDLPVFGDVDLAKWWEESSIDRRRALVAVLVEAVEVGPSLTRGTRTFEEDRVRIVWR